MSNKLSVLSRVRKEDLKLDPYPHLAIDCCLDEAVYRELEEAYVSDEVILGHDFYHVSDASAPPNNERRQLSALGVLTGETRVPQIWHDFIAYHTSQEFFHELLDICEPAIKATVPDLEERLGTSLRDAPVGVRRLDDDLASVVLDCQPGINTPVREACTVLGPHLDNPVELYAGLLYFRDDHDDSQGGEFVVQKWRSGTPRLFGKNRILPEDVIDCAYVPYRRNQFAFFINTINTIHAVMPRQATGWSRRLVNIIGEVYPKVPEGIFDVKPYLTA